MSKIALLLKRNSVPIRTLEAPGPDKDELETILEAATRVPDHGKLTPWRLHVFTGQGRAKLADMLVGAYRAETPRDQQEEKTAEKLRSMPQAAPVLVAVTSKLTHGHKIPAIEQRLSGGAVCFALLAAATALGYAGQWLTGWGAYSPAVKAALGVAAEDDILGFIGLGTPPEDVPSPRDRPKLKEVVTRWEG